MGIVPILLTEHKTYRASWYAEEKNILEQVLPKTARVNHIGSIAVDTIWAKLIADILVEIPNGTDLSPLFCQRLKSHFYRGKRQKRRCGERRGRTAAAVSEVVQD